MQLLVLFPGKVGSSFVGETKCTKLLFWPICPLHLWVDEIDPCSTKFDSVEIYPNAYTKVHSYSLKRIFDDKPFYLVRATNKLRVTPEIEQQIGSTIYQYFPFIEFATLATEI